MALGQCEAVPSAIDVVVVCLVSSAVECCEVECCEVGCCLVVGKYARSGSEGGRARTRGVEGLVVSESRSPGPVDAWAVVVLKTAEARGQAAYVVSWLLILDRRAKTHTHQHLHSGETASIQPNSDIKHQQHVHDM